MILINLKDFPGSVVLKNIGVVWIHTKIRAMRLLNIKGKAYLYTIQTMEN